MGNYSVPASIRKYKPKGTMVKVINGSYYVYEYFCRKDENGKWKTKMGKLVGTIREGVGFVPNDSYNNIQSNTTLEYGQYALAFANSKQTLGRLLYVFNPIDAYQIYFMALIHFVNGFTYLKNIDVLFQQSYFAELFPDLKLSYHVLSSLLDSLGRKQEKVIRFEQILNNDSSHELAIDGHVISSSSHLNDLSENGNKFHSLKDSQINVLMAYDINKKNPVLSRIYEGGNLDKVSIKDVMRRFEFHDTLFIVDRGFYSNDNIMLFSQYHNQYIIPLSPNLLEYKEATSDMKLDRVFVYESKKKRATIEYRETVDKDKNSKIIIYRDINQSVLDQSDYLKNMESGNKKYSEENYNRVKDFFGVIVLKTNCIDKCAKEIYELYKRRWSIETFYNYFKNNADIKALHMNNYYMTQGLSFIMLIVGLIQSEFDNAMKQIKGKTIDDVLLEGRFIKIHKSKKQWYIENMKKSRQELMQLLNVDFSEIDQLNKQEK